MRLLDYHYLLLLITIIPVILAYLSRIRGNCGAIRYSDVSRLRAVKPTLRHKLSHSLVMIRTIVLVLLVVALARPQAGWKSSEILTEGIEIMIALDVSGSMLGEDFKPKNRLQTAKEVVAEFIKGRTNDHIGMVTFGEVAFTQCPLTLDYAVLLELLSGIEIGAFKDATAIGSAIATCLNRLKDTKAKSKVIILVTDGVNNAGEIDPITAAKAAQALGVKIYTIAVGKKGPVPYPVHDPLFGKSYQMVESNIDEETLMQIAEITDGKFYRATDSQALKNVFETIDKLEKTDIKVKEYTQYNDRFSLFILPAFILLILEIIMANTIFRRVP